MSSGVSPSPAPPRPAMAGQLIRSPRSRAKRDLVAARDHPQGPVAKVSIIPGASLISAPSRMLPVNARALVAGSPQPGDEIQTPAHTSLRLRRRMWVQPKHALKTIETCAAPCNVMKLKNCAEAEICTAGKLEPFESSTALNSVARLWQRLAPALPHMRSITSNNTRCHRVRLGGPAQSQRLAAG
jgi:hypothetical protein